MTSYVYWMMGYDSEEDEIVPTVKTVKQRHLVQTQLRNNKDFKFTTAKSRKQRSQRNSRRNQNKVLKRFNTAQYISLSGSDEAKQSGQSI